VLLALMIPSRTAIDRKEFVQEGLAALAAVEQTAHCAGQRMAIKTLEDISQKTQSTLLRMEHTLHPRTTFCVMSGLVLGKPIASWLSVRFGWASLPAGVFWKQLNGVGWVAGIGFTMSFFIAGLSFVDNDALTVAKLGIPAALLRAGTIGSIILVCTSHPIGELQ
jgi:NhaA family Na+:H+ antiporter